MLYLVWSFLLCIFHLLLSIIVHYWAWKAHNYCLYTILLQTSQNLRLPTIIFISSNQPSLFVETSTWKVSIRQFHQYINIIKSSCYEVIYRCYKLISGRDNSLFQDRKTNVIDKYITFNNCGNAILSYVRLAIREKEKYYSRSCAYMNLIQFGSSYNTF